MGPQRQGPAPESPAEVSRDLIHAQIEKIIISRGFLASERMVRLLRFIVDASLTGKPEQLKEYVLGVEVFDRSADFDPRTDPIVRVEARRLRGKLRHYYDGEGRTDEVIVEVPTGAYVARFERRSEVHRSDAPGQLPASVVVLPFSNLSPEADTDYFSDGLTEEIIHALTKVDGLTVVAWQSASKLKEETANLQRIGQLLRVGSVLQGSVRRLGDRVRILAKLAETGTGRFLWSETYDRRMEDLFAIQQDISRQVSESLRVKLFGPPPETITRACRMPAYDLYLRGRFHWNKRTPEGFQRAMECFSGAVECDAECAPAYAGLADTYSLLAQHGLAAAHETMPRAKSAALKALAIDAELAEAWTSLAMIESLYEWKWTEAEEHYLRAIEIQPGYATAQHWYACDLLALLGRFEEAMAVMETAVRLDPLSPVIASSVGYLALLQRRMEDSLAAQRQALDLDGYFLKAITGMGRVYIHQGKYALAVQMLEKGQSLAGDVPTLLGALAQAYGMSGDARAARAVIEKMSRLARKKFVPCTAFAMAHIGLGEKERALEWLERGCERREASVCGLAVHPGYDPLRGEPRFEALIRRMGMNPQPLLPV